MSFFLLSIDPKASPWVLASKSFFVGLGTKSRPNSESQTHLQKEYLIPVHARDFF